MYVDTENSTSPSGLSPSCPSHLTMTVVSEELHGTDGIDPTKVDLESQPKKFSEPPPTEQQFSFPWFFPVSFLSVTFGCGICVYCAWEEIDHVSFIVTNYVLFLACFYLVRMVERVISEEDKVRVRLFLVGVGCWFLSQMVMVIPPALAAVVRMVAGAILVSCIYRFHKNKKSHPDLDVGKATIGDTFFLFMFFGLLVLAPVLIILERGYNFYVYLTSKDLDDAGSSPPPPCHGRNGQHHVISPASTIQAFIPENVGHDQV